MAVSLLLGGCARPVAIDPPTPRADAAAACRAFVDALPSSLPTVGDRREVDPSAGFTAAYGDPPVSVRCGVPTPTALDPTSELVTVDGVDWLPEQLTNGWMMTTVGRMGDVEIVVPSDQGPAPSVAADLGPTIDATLPER